MLRRFALAGLLVASVLGLTACSSGPKAPEPTPLGPVAALMGTRLVWTAQVGEGDASFVPRVADGRVYAAGAAGTVTAINAATGADVWRLDLRSRLATGVGSDGSTAAVVTVNNLLVAIRDGQEVWRARLLARSFTPPLVAGGRVFVLTADRSVYAYDARNGARLWNQTRPGEPLVLSQPGLLLAVGDTLVAGVAGRLVGLNPDNGAVRWEAPVATARGTNEVERLVDVLGPAARIGNSVCVRAFASALGCVDAASGTTVWSRAARGTVGVHGDERLVYGSESDGTFTAWQRSTGEPAWSTDRLKHRRLGAPLALGRVIAVGDGAGLVHLVSREDGSEMTRMSTDGSPIVAPPVLAGDTLVVQTQRGVLYAWQPE